MQGTPSESPATSINFDPSALSPDRTVGTPTDELASRLARRKLRDSVDTLRKTVKFVHKGSEAVTQKKISSTVASFLPTSLLEILESAVVDETVNPRLPSERPGIYLCLALGGLHAMAELPIETDEFESKLKEAMRTVASTVESSGGELVRMTGDTALAVWPLPPPIEPESLTEGGPSAPMTQASFFPQREMNEAVKDARACTQHLLRELHGKVLWTDTSVESLARARSQQRNQAGDTPSSDKSSPESGSSPILAARAKSLWGSVKSSSSKASATTSSSSIKLGSGPSSGLSMFDAIKAAKNVAEQDRGLEFKLELGASLTVAIAQAIHVGGSNGRWEYVVCAPEISAAQSVLSMADAGELLVSESLWSAFSPTDLQPHLSFEEWKRVPRRAAKKLVPKPDAVQERIEIVQAVPVAAVKSYMPGAVWAKILAGNPEWIVGHGEWRMVSVLTIRMFAPRNAPLLTQIAAYTAAVSLFQASLYKCTGTFKHMVQDHEGCTAVACLGLPPFVHSEVTDSRGAVTAALEMRSELSKMGVNTHAAIVLGRVWVGSVGSDYRHEYVAIGPPMQLASQMLGFCTDAQPILTDATTSQANKTRFNFTPLKMTIRVPGQLKQHTMLAITEPRQIEASTKTANVSFEMAQWLRTHSLTFNKRLTSNFSSATISDAAKQQMREIFRELDLDKSGKISLSELLIAIEEVDVAEASNPRSLRYNVERMILDMDSGDNGEIAFDQFLAMAAAANENGMSNNEAQQASATQNLPLLLTAHTTRRLLQRRLGDEFVQIYEQHRNDNATKVSRPHEASKPSTPQTTIEDTQTMLTLMLEGEDEMNFPSFVELVKRLEPERQAASQGELRQLFDAHQKDKAEKINRRDYIRVVMFETLASKSSRAVDLFLKLDENRDGNVTKDEFKDGLKKLGLDMEHGFIESDAEALFEALDADGSGSLEYVEIATSLRGRARAEIIRRLRRKSRRASHRRTSGIGVPARRRRSASSPQQEYGAPSLRKSSLGGRRKSSTAGFGRAIEEEGMKRVDRLKSVTAIMDQARAKAARRALGGDDGQHADTSPRIQKELELGAFGSVGMSVGSRPRTPADDRAMRDWVLDHGISAHDLQVLNQAARGPVKKPEEMTKDEKLAWLQETGVRTNFNTISDILEDYGLKSEFEAAPVRDEQMSSPSQASSPSPQSSRSGKMSPSKSRSNSRIASPTKSGNASPRAISPAPPVLGAAPPLGVRNARERALRPKASP